MKEGYKEVMRNIEEDDKEERKAIIIMRKKYENIRERQN